MSAFLSKLSTELWFLLLILAQSKGTTEGSQGTTVSLHSAPALVTQVSTSLLLMWIGKDFTNPAEACYYCGNKEDAFIIELQQCKNKNLWCVIGQCHWKHCTRCMMCNLTWIYCIENRIYDFRWSHTTQVWKKSKSSRKSQLIVMTNKETDRDSLCKH